MSTIRLPGVPLVCGFVAYVGKEEAKPLLLEALARLGERGHHAAGLAVQNGSGIERVRVRGHVRRLARLARLRPLAGTAGIGHVRWATDEPPTVAGAHPQVDCHGQLAVALAGGIELGPSLPAELERRGHVLRSRAAAETLAHLIEDVWVPPLHLALTRALERAEGRFALAAMSAREPGRIVVACRGLPVVVGRWEGATFAASDEAALPAGARGLVRLADGEIAVLDGSGYDLLRADSLRRLHRPPLELAADPRHRAGGGNGRPAEAGAIGVADAIADALRGRLARDGWTARLAELASTAGAVREAGALVLVSGSGSRPAAAIGARALRELGRVPASPAAARWVARPPCCRSGAVVVGIARAGEEAPLRRALRSARRAGVPALVLDGGPPARDGHFEGFPRLGVRAGPDDEVVPARPFAAEVVTFALLALWCGRLRGLHAAERRALVAALDGLPYVVERGLEGATAGAAALSGALRGPGRLRLVGAGYGVAAAREGARWLRGSGWEAIGLSAEAAQRSAPPPGAAALLFACTPAEGRELAPVAARLAAAGGEVAAVLPEGVEVAEARLTLVVPRTFPLLQPILSLLPLHSLTPAPAEEPASPATGAPAKRAGIA